MHTFATHLVFHTHHSIVKMKRESGENPELYP